MSVDLSQFHQVFFEESFEGLDSMESALMELDPSAVDAETINTIFRAAHSIKGGSATFGFSIVADFTHVLETLLDEIRSDARPIRQDDVDLFLQSVDCLRDLLSALQSDETPDAEQSATLGKAFEEILAQDPQSPNYLTVPSESSPSGDIASRELEDSSSVKEGPEGAEEIDGPWRIRFIPGRDILRTGNEPLRILRELEELGRTCVTPIFEQVPDYSVLDPEACYLGFDIVFRDRISKSKLDEVFEWVVDESDLEIVLACHQHDAEDQGSDESGIAVSENDGWSVSFKPGEDVLRTGNEPLRIFRELADAGLRHVSAQVESLPRWSLLNPESCYLAWQLNIDAGCDESQIHEAFEWVVDESDIVVTRQVSSAKGATDAADSSSNGQEVDSISLSKSESVSVEETLESREPVSIAGGEPDSQVAIASNKSAPQERDIPKAAPAKKTSSNESTSIRVGIDKVDTLINMVGELVITQSMLGELGNDFDINCLPKLREGLSQLEQNTRELQESVMRIRMLPISFAFSRFPRMVRDLGKRLNKKIHLELIGEQTELDKTVMEKIGDPLVHLVRNAIDHGIEQPEERVEAGKSDTGMITLNAYHQGGNVVIEITDDGKGLDRSRIVAKALDSGMIQEKEAQSLSDEQVYDMIFQPGFSTAQEVSDVSGRGVGMDVVRRNIQALNGSVEINSTIGKGSKITIRLPLTLAILDGQLVRVGDQTYIFPLVSIVESLQSKDERVSRVAGGCDVFQLRDEYVPIIQLHEIFNIDADTNSLDEALMVVVEYDGEKVGVVVDDLQAQQQVVIKSLEQNYQRVEGISGATILGDGTVALILDIPGLVKLAGITHQQQVQLVSPAGSTPSLKSIA
ncbi:MAG: chemotaxis protein CheA [Cellvibrionaceae bacterium]|nr:chemotaxis protein CheA [Cellvibrionaceae bacterium]